MSNEQKRLPIYEFRLNAGSHTQNDLSGKEETIVSDRAANVYPTFVTHIHLLKLHPNDNMKFSLVRVVPPAEAEEMWKQADAKREKREAEQRELLKAKLRHARQLQREVEEEEEEENEVAGNKTLSNKVPPQKATTQK